MSLWMVRAGSYGEQEKIALDNSVVAIGWNELSDLSKIKDKKDLEVIYKKEFPDTKKMQAAIAVGQIWRFVNEIQKDDLVVLPLKTQSAIAIGRIESDYEYKKLAENVKHIRHVRWLKTLPRTVFEQDLLYSMGSLMTVCNIERNDAERRVESLLEKGVPDQIPKESELEEVIDIEEYVKDRITKYIVRKFKGHGLARLVAAILKAQGYTIKISPPGPDGGVDILASAGPLGFDQPRICVQVKSSSSPVDVRVFRELRGVMSKVKAEQGLLVSWGSFNNKVLSEAKDDFFSIRLWDSNDLTDAIFKFYDKFSDELKAELPLKRIWALVLEEEQV